MTPNPKRLRKLIAYRSRREKQAQAELARREQQRPRELSPDERDAVLTLGEDLRRRLAKIFQPIESGCLRFARCSAQSFDWRPIALRIPTPFV